MRPAIPYIGRFASRIGWSSRRSTAPSDTRISHHLGNNARVILEALILALFIRIFLFQPFDIPSGSMIPTLRVGDYLFVEKFAYGYSRYSFPFGPDLFSGRIWAKAPKRGDVVVFKLPGNGDTDYIKRVIGLPGDHIQMINGILYINGLAVKKKRIGDFIMRDASGYERHVARYRETLPNGVSYSVIDLVPGGDAAADNTTVYRVPPGHYFMMGDNRDDSMDSRFPEVGYVPFENLIGRAEIVFFSFHQHAGFWQFWNWPVDVRWSRIFHWVD
jgi:signal peptidase I